MIDGCTRNGTLSCVRKLSAVRIANAIEDAASCTLTASLRKTCGSRNTISAPTVIPNMAMEIATNAKWYHMVTLKILVSRISYMIIDAATRNRPA